MKNLRRSVAVILLLSTLFTLSACANTTIKNDDEVRLLWDELVTNRTSQYIEITEPHLCGKQVAASSAPAQATADVYFSDVVEPSCNYSAYLILKKIGELEYTEDIFDQDKQCVSILLYGKGNSSLKICLYDDGIVIHKNNEEKFSYKLEYDKESFVNELKSLTFL